MHLQQLLKFTFYYERFSVSTKYIINHLNLSFLFLSIIQKTLKELSDEKEGYLKVNNTERVQSIEVQEKVLNSYLPKQLSKEEILAEIAKLDDKSMPNIMKHFKTNFAGKVDMSLVSQLARSL